jgi:hypothetical protein
LRESQTSRETALAIFQFQILAVIVYFCTAKQILAMTRTSAARRGYEYKVCAAKQHKKLANRETDWNLPGISNTEVAIRTRGAGKGRPDYSSRKKWFNEPESSEDEVSVVEEVEIDGLEALQDDPPEEDVKPEATRAIVDLNPMMQTFDKHCRCPECDRKLITSMKMVYIASRFILTCSNPSCGYIYYSHPPAEATIGDQDAPMRERSTDYAVNVLWVPGFMLVGNGCTEAACLLGLLGLPPSCYLPHGIWIPRNGPVFYDHKVLLYLRNRLREDIRNLITPLSATKLEEQAQLRKEQYHQAILEQAKLA